MHALVFDIETKNTFQDVGSRDAAALDISVIVVYDYKTDTYFDYTEETLSELWPLIESADMLIGYNSDHFDIPLLNKYYSGDLTQLKSLDLLKEIHKSLGRRIKLDDVAAGTLGKKKIAHGLEAVEWWKTGEIDKIIKYCVEDVRITKEVYEYALENGRLKYKDLTSTKEFPINTGTWNELPEQNSMNYTLPF